NKTIHHLINSAQQKVTLCAETAIDLIEDEPLKKQSDIS
ncbi:hypothetical protein GASC598B02_004130, partial [Gilliamella apicola SCGC AB-598-B02]